MPKAKIKVSSDHDAPETYVRLKKLFKTSPEIRELDPDMTVKFDDARLRGAAQGRHFRAEMSVKESEPHSTVRVVLELPLLLGPFLGRIEKKIKKKLEATLGTKKTKKKS